MYVSVCDETDEEKQVCEETEVEEEEEEGQTVRWRGEVEQGVGTDNTARWGSRDREE